MTTVEPAIPKIGVNDVMVGAPDPVKTVKLEAVLAVPPGVVTDRMPLVAPLGTVAVIWVSELTAKNAAVPLKETTVAPVKYSPVIVIDAPGRP